MHIAEPHLVRQLDQRLTQELGLQPELLMETAGRAIADEIGRRLGPGRERWAVVLAGVGNNGGDGFVVGRVLACRGWRVECFVAGELAKLTATARVHFDAMVKLGGIELRKVQQAPRGAELQGLRRSLGRAAVIVDALTGIGLQSDLREPVLTLASQLDGRYRALTVAADVPSGLCAATGLVRGAAVHCHLVMTMVAAKPGLFLNHGPELWRELQVVDIGVPPAWLERCAPRGSVIDTELLTAALASRPGGPGELGHKNSHGHLFVVAGSSGKGGAALLCSHAALRTGAGLVTLGTAGEIRGQLEGRLPDVMVEAIRGGASEIKRIEKLIAGKAALAVGPGLGTGAAEVDLVARLLALSTVPVVLDADGLSALAQKPDLAEPAAGRLVLTPHPGEMARLLGKEVAEVEADRLAAAREAARRFAAVVVLKGPRTLVAAPDGTWSVANAPNAALAKAGTGDVLTGAIGALLARGLAPLAAAQAGVGLHARAGVLLRAAFGGRGGLASDLPERLAAAMAEIELAGAAE
ncbi:MAG: NAD(P)H-hydrate dehydratase [Deltaproteobacteria bacterium]|nr:NAD(P)H-hydrate dehydratase [Deltaproteobacteria bacterium]